MRALELYCGIGGWSLGLQLAGIQVVTGVDNCQAALRTYRGNLANHALEADILHLDYRVLPKDIDVIVGSPPCTQFSFSNRGGNGSIGLGLSHIEAFLKVVALYQPRFWLMENVPRVKGILERELFEPSGSLAPYRHLFDDQDARIDIFDFSKFGLPQIRKRCIAGKFPSALLNAYLPQCVQGTLGDVVDSLQARMVTDLHYGDRISRSKITGLDYERPLSQEEIRLNMQAKIWHPIYNRMRFPDRLSRASRTVTATCTRVSRESIIVPLAGSGFRRLTVRERAILQSFPVNFEFCTSSLNVAFRLTGNALPPLFAYYVGCSLMGISAQEIKPPGPASEVLLSRKLNDIPRFCVSSSAPPKVNRPNRTFRGTVPSLHFGSGVRFELTNHLEKSKHNNSPHWVIRFVFGDPRNVMELPITYAIGRKIRRTKPYKDFLDSCEKSLRTNFCQIIELNATNLQSAWASFGRAKSPGPFDMIDALEKSSKIALSEIKVSQSMAYKRLLAILREAIPASRGAAIDVAIRQRKLRDESVRILVGVLISAWCIKNVQVLRG